MSLQDVWTAFQLTYLSADSLEPVLRFDNPFLLHYVLFHHYRSLGWVVKGGIKFCVDYLLYKRGPVFSHAE
jgi:tRNA-splicing endonuclease subunit Sen2